MPSKETYEDNVAGEDRDAEHHGSDLKKSVDDPLPLRKNRPDYKTIASNATIQTTGPAKDRGQRMNYEFDLEEWLPRFSLQELHGHYSGNDITSPCDICNNELLRRGMKNEFEWGEPVPADIFVHSIGEPGNRYATKIGGLPYRSAGLPWPKTASGRSMALIAQFNFTNSTDIVGKLPGDLRLVFGDDSDGPMASRSNHAAAKASQGTSSIQRPVTSFGFLGPRKTDRIVTGQAAGRLS